MPPDARDPRRRVRRLGAVVLACTLALAGCALRGSHEEASSGPAGELQPQPLPPTAAPVPPPPPSSPFLQGEPTIGVLLDTGPAVTFTTLVDGEAAGRALAPGTHRAWRGGASLVLDGVALGPLVEVHLAPWAGARFRAVVHPPRAAAQDLALAGAPRLCLQGGEVALIERVPLETYLAGVVPTEMSPTWPEAALAAQAVAARSYASAMVQARWREPWQLHWHYTVDMAYAGAGARRSAAVDQALRETRGVVLAVGDQPVPALFCASSGGRTETARHLPSAAARPLPWCMPVLDDPADAAGAEALGKRDTHWRWQADLSLAQVAAAVDSWLAAHPELHRPSGALRAVRVASRWPDSGRVAEVALRYGSGGRGAELTLPATDFRLAVGPSQVRSTFWTACTLLPGGHWLRVAGRGFGHGVGLSQVSAYELAREGASAAAILERFYRGCSLVRLYP